MPFNSEHIWESVEICRLRTEKKRLVEAVKKMLNAYKRAEECSCPYCLEDFERERAEVDRLIAAADCEGEG